VMVKSRRKDSSPTAMTETSDAEQEAQRRAKAMAAWGSADS
jgi:hypothetical protein